MNNSILTFVQISYHCCVQVQRFTRRAQCTPASLTGQGAQCPCLTITP